MLRIGSTTVHLKSRHNLEVLVPDVLFYENQQVATYECSYIVHIRMYIQNSSFCIKTALIQ